MAAKVHVRLPAQRDTVRSPITERLWVSDPEPLLLGYSRGELFCVSQTAPARAPHHQPSSLSSTDECMLSRFVCWKSRLFYDLLPTIGRSVLVPSRSIRFQRLDLL